MSKLHAVARPVVLSLLVLGVSNGFGMAQAEDSPPLKVKQHQTTFQSDGMPITLECYEPQAEGIYPGVLILHGSTGMQVGQDGYRSMAQRLAEHGYVALVVRYFDRTGTLSADTMTMRQHFEIWLDTIAEAIEFVARQPKVDGDRIGLIGISLGSYLSTSEAARNPRVKAVAGYFGGLPKPLRTKVKHLPPILILHGDADRIVPISEAHALEKVCKERGFVYEMKIYKGAGHGFNDLDSDDAFARVKSFLDKHLKAVGNAQEPVEVEVPKQGVVP